MSAITDGKASSASLGNRVAAGVSALVERGFVPGLAVVRVGEDSAPAAYVRSKGLQTREAGMASFEHMRAAETPQHELIAFIAGLNAHAQVHGILVHLPLLREYWKDR